MRSDHYGDVLAKGVGLFVYYTANQLTDIVNSTVVDGTSGRGLADYSVWLEIFHANVMIQVDCWIRHDEVILIIIS